MIVTGITVTAIMLIGRIMITLIIKKKFHDNDNNGNNNVNQYNQKTRNTSQSIRNTQHTKNRSTNIDTRAIIMSNRGTHQGINRVRDNTPYNPNNRVNQRSTIVIFRAAANVLNTTVMNSDYASTNTKHTKRHYKKGYLED